MTYMIIRAVDLAGGHVATLGIGASPDRPWGAIRYRSVEGDFLSRGKNNSKVPVEYAHFGYPVYCPESSVIEIAQVKLTLAVAFDSGFSGRPDTIDWQEWFDSAPLEGDDEEVDFW